MNCPFLLVLKVVNTESFLKSYQENLLNTVLLLYLKSTAFKKGTYKESFLGG